MTGRLVARDGTAFSYAASFFRYAEPHGIVLYPASLSVVDESTGTFLSERRTERADLGLASGETGKLSLRVGTWSLCESGAMETRPTCRAYLEEAFVAGFMRRHTHAHC